MQYEKPLIFIYPISDTLMNLKKAIEASGQPVDVYEIDDLRELLQTIPALGQSLVLGSNAKKCAKFLQAAKKLIKQYDTKLVIISQKQYPRRTVDKLMKFGLNDIIFEPVPDKTLMYKVNLALRSLKVPTKQELEKKFKAEQAKQNGESEDDITFSDEKGVENSPNEENENTKGNRQPQEESEEELLASIQDQKIERPNNDEGFDPNDLNAGNTKQAVEKDYVDDGYEEVNETEEDLLANMPSKPAKQNVEEQDTDFNSKKMNVATAQETEFSATDIDDLAADKDDEEMISLGDLAASGPDNATNIEGEAEEYQTHMEGKGSTEHIEDDEHEMSEDDMEFAEMEALAEISKMDTKMKGKNSSDDSIEDLMQGDVRGQDKIDENMQGDIYGEGAIDGNMQGDMYGEDDIEGNMVGDVNLNDLMEGGNLEGDILSKLADDGNLEGNVLSKEKNIKTYYDAEDINHQDQYEPNLEHSGDDQEYGGHMEGDVYNTEEGLDDDMASLMADEVDLNDLTGDGSVDELGGHLEGDVYASDDGNNGEMDGLISEDPQAERLKGRGGTDQIKENDLEGENHSLMGDQGGNMAGNQAGTEHIETHYNTNFAEEIEKKKKANPLMEFQSEEDYYGEANLAKAKKKSALDMYESEDLYGQGHTRSLEEDKEKRATDDWGEQKNEADTGFSEFEDQKKKNPKLEIPYELQEVEYDDEGQPVPKLEVLAEDNKPKHPSLEMPYEMESDWSNKSDGKLKAQYSLKELDEVEKKQPKLEVPKMSIDEQNTVYDDVDINSLIDDFGSDEEFGDEHVEELKEMAKSLQIQGSIYDDFEPEDYTKLEKYDPWDDDFKPSEKKNEPLPDQVNPEDAMGLDTLVALSQIHQTVTMRPKDAIYATNKMFWTEHKCLSCSLQIDGGNVEEIYNAITDPIVSEDYLQPEEWNVIRTKVLQAAKKSSEAFWQGSDEEGTPKIYFRPFFEDDVMFGGVVFYFPQNIKSTKAGLYEAYAESMKMLIYSSLPQAHTLKQRQAEEENPVEKETLLGRMKGAYKETFVEEAVDEKTGQKGTRFGNWLKDKIEKIAS